MIKVRQHLMKINKLQWRFLLIGSIIFTLLLSSIQLITVPNITTAASDDTSWALTTVDSAGWSDTSLAFDPLGNPAISYFDSTNGYLKYASWNDDTGWELETVDDTSNNTGYFSSLAFDSSGNPAISYCDGTNYYLKYASWNEGTGWELEIVDDTSTYDGYFSSLAFDPSGNPAISYMSGDSTNYYLKYASWNDDTGWKLETVDNPGTYTGYYTSLAFDSSGNPAISYYDSTNGDLKYASWNGTSWDLYTVDNTDTYDGYFASLAFDPSGNPAISHMAYDGTNYYLKYASWNGTSWDMYTIDNASTYTGYYTSLAFDSSGNPAISYQDSTNGDLKYASWNGTSWEKQTVDSTSTSTGYYTSLAFDHSGNPAISYLDNTNSKLKYAVMNQGPDQPVNDSPGDGTGITGLEPTLQSSAFNSPVPWADHSASRWQITTTSGDYSSPIWDSGTDGSHLTSIAVPTGELDYGYTYYWHVRYQDSYGIWSAYSDEFSFSTDTDPPVVTVTVDPGSPPSLSGTATDTYTAIASVEYRVDGGSWADAAFIADPADEKTGTYTITLSGLADGSYTIEVRATDAAGNTANSYASATVTVDTSEPVVTADNTDISTGDSSPEISGTVTDATSNIYSVEYRVDGGSWQTAPFKVDSTDPNSVNYDFNTFLPPGDHTVEIRATDVPGNTISSGYTTIALSISSGGGSSWWIILIAVLGGLLVIGAIVYFFYWQRRGSKEAVEQT